MDQKTHFQGGFSKYILLDHPRNVFLKDNTPPEVSVLLKPFSIGIHFADRADVKIGSTGVIQGAGGIGILSLAAALEAGAHRTIVIGARGFRLELEKEFGADVTINIKAVKTQTPGGYGADVVFEGTGVPQSTREGIDMLREADTTWKAATSPMQATMTMKPFSHFVLKNTNLVAVRDSSIGHFVRGRPSWR